MSQRSYNAVNGVPTCLDGGAQNGILREEFKFGGMIVSDCDAIADAWHSHKFTGNGHNATALAILAGTDMDCGATFTQGAPGAISSGLLPVHALNTAVGRSLTMRFRLGEFDPPEQDTAPLSRSP